MTSRELYFISGSPPCWTVMLALEAKGLDYTPRRLNNSQGDQKSDAFLRINPRGQVPVLIDDDRTICETLAVIAYLDAAYPEPPLLGSTPVETARIWQAICNCDGNLRTPVSALSRPLFRGKAEEAAEQIAGAAATLRDELGLLDAGLSTGPWLAGESMSAADLVVYPVLMQLSRAAARDDAVPLDLGLHPFSDNFPGLDRWCERIEGLKGYDTAYPPHWK
jgi:glutathione S-transferase